jgi:NADH dehydrogenase
VRSAPTEQHALQHGIRLQQPGVAEVAMQSGLYVGHRIRKQVAGEQTDKPFSYHDLGSAAYLSRGRAVVSAGPLKTGGFLGWWSGCSSTLGS